MRNVNTLKKINLSLRQRQLLHDLQSESGYITGQMLASKLRVSSRTIRNDITEMNQLLEGTGISIISKHRFGYRLESQNPKTLNHLTRSTTSFLTREERLRHVAQRLCRSDAPINLDELADEMYISKPTLELDLKEFRKQYLLSYPQIELIRARNRISFEDTEWKRREILTQLYSTRWDYQTKGNEVFQYEYPDENIISACTAAIDDFLTTNGWTLEDINIVRLDLKLAIAAARIKEGHSLSEDHSQYINPQIITQTDLLIDTIENKLNVTLNEFERHDIYEHISCSKIEDIDMLRNNLVAYFEPSLIRFVNDYLNLIESQYHMDLFDDEEFYLALLIFFRYLSLPVHFMNPDVLKESFSPIHYAVEFELAYLIQPLALEYYGFYLSQIELFYLCSLLSGALAHIAPQKLRAVLLCHHNLSMAWGLRMQLESSYGAILTISNVLPMFRKISYDFDQVDLILTTTDVTLPEAQRAKQFTLSASFAGQAPALEQFLSHLRFTRFYQNRYPSLRTLLNDARWFVQTKADDYFDALSQLGQQMLDAQIVDETWLADLFRRENASTFYERPALTVVHSPIPSSKTAIYLSVLDHRVRVENKKIRVILMVATTENDRGLYFKLLNDLYNYEINIEELQYAKTQEAVLEVLCPEK
ncbi:MAG: HTH domain-containing protein [Lachnospiraceae bacterium]|nr:HTH domain-containing protein [Lachnospiraceae bacterium]